MKNKLPTKLAKEPLVDALFEMRFEGAGEIADILPGFLFNKLEGEVSITRLPGIDVPKPIRDSDPVLKYSPAIRLEWDKYFISIGSHSLIISCNIPYPGWQNFRESILKIVELVGTLEMIESVNRYSLKYVNLLQASSIADQIKKINMDIKLGEITVGEEQFSLSIQRKEKQNLHILQIISGANGKLQDGRDLFGIIVDIDSIRDVENVNFKGFLLSLKDDIEELRQENKHKFFECLTEEAITGMEPSYE